MRRGTRIAIGLLVALAVLLAINTAVVGNQTKSAEVSVDGGRIVQVPAGAVQVLEEGPENPRGAGAPIVLLHCYACSLRWWDRLAPLLAERHRVVRVDLLGFGGSEKPSGGYGIEAQADAVAAALDRLRIQGAVVVGHSMGFSVATALAESASQLVDRLVNLDEGPNPDSCSLDFLASLAHVPILGEAIWRLAPGFAIKDGYAEAFAPGYELEDGFDDPDQVLADHDAMTYTAFTEAQDANEDYREEISLPDRLRPLAIPVMSVFGTEDQLCDPEESQEAFASLPGARLEQIDGAGHSPNVEKPEETAALIEDFAAVTATARPPSPKRRGGRPSRTRR